MAFLDRFKGKAQDDAGATTRSGPSTFDELDAMPGDDTGVRGHGAMDMNLSALPATAMGDNLIDRLSKAGISFTTVSTAP